MNLFIYKIEIKFVHLYSTTKSIWNEYSIKFASLAILNNASGEKIPVKISAAC